MVGKEYSGPGSVAYMGGIFDPDKCEVLHLGRSNLKRQFTVKGKTFNCIEEQRDLGVQVHSSQKVTTQIDQVLKKGAISIINKMAVLKIAAQFFEDLFEAFASERKSGLKNILYLISLCLVLGMGAGGIVYICLKTLECNFSVALAVFGTLSVVIPGAMFFSKYLRCFILIFLISCGTKKGRNALITLGTSTVLFNCAQNSFHNLKELVGNLNCFLIGMLPSIKYLLSRYKEVMEWISKHKVSKNIFVHIADDLKIYHTVNEDAIRIKLNETSINIENQAKNIISMLSLFSSVCKLSIALICLWLAVLFTWFYIRRFLTDIKFENNFITNQFLKFDEKQKEAGKPHLLQLTKKENKNFIRIPALCLSKMELRIMARFLAPVLSHLCIWIILIMLDYGVYLLTDSIRHHIDHLPTINITMKAKFSKYTTTLYIFKTTEEDEETFSSDIHLSKDACILKPTDSMSKLWILLVVLLAILLLLTLLSAKLTILKIFILSSFYKETEEKRVRFLHEKILQKRRLVKLFNIEEVQYPAANMIFFWFPIFKMKQQQNELQKQNNAIIRNFDEVHTEL
ncbi:dendritic cell-specific transmembrane protein [Hypanus sabinus]|uniref:dendritic cell-specific transmembrane protein n=1 Tax=Hypanus sabinus TaxID=79690 RepID=UPI0028C42023|nr:dendritic cell-specific transmembrane protein [Hypanus sabinus]